MSMLSERRSKSKWSLNPRGHLWTQDENKFGQKMLEKMGWEKGDGLGSERQGITDIISVKSIDENRGLGFKGNKDEWIAHQDDFASVLADLSHHHGNGEENKEETSSLESKSKSVKKRIHYHKYAKSKDTSKYSSSDLNSILGSEAVGKKRKIKDEESSKDVFVSSNEPEKCSNGLVVIRGGNIQDYFAEKMMKLKKKAKLNNSEESKEASTEKKINVDENVTELDDNPSEPPIKKKKKSKKINVDENVTELDDNPSEPPIKKKKKSKKKNNETELDDVMVKDSSKVKRKNCDVSVDKSEDNYELISGDFSKVSRKKKKKYEDSNQSDDKTEAPKEMESKSSTKKSKKKKKRDVNKDSEQFSSIEGDSVPKEVEKNGSQTKKCKKNKKKRGDDDSEVPSNKSEETLIKANVKDKYVTNRRLPYINKSAGRKTFGSWPARRFQTQQDKIRLQNERRQLRKDILKKPVEELEIKFNGSNLQSLVGYGNAP